MTPDTIVDLGRGILLAFGGFILLASSIGFIAPQWLIRTVRSAWHKKPSMALAILARLILGSALLYCASSSRFPVAFLVFGTLGLAAALVLFFAGWHRIDRIMAWAQSWPLWLVRTWLLFGIGAGVFVLYGIA